MQRNRPEADRVQDCSQRLGDRVGALAAALGAAGVDPDAAARILGSAAAAVMHAVTLESLLAGRERVAAPVASATGAEPSESDDVALAA